MSDVRSEGFSPHRSLKPVFLKFLLIVRATSGPIFIHINLISAVLRWLEPILRLPQGVNHADAG